MERVRPFVVWEADKGLTLCPSSLSMAEDMAFAEYSRRGLLTGARFVNSGALPGIGGVGHHAN